MNRHFGRSSWRRIATIAGKAVMMAPAESGKDTESGRTMIVRLTPETHRALRNRVAEEDTSIQNWSGTLVE